MKLNLAYKKRGMEGIQKNTLKQMELVESKAGVVDPRNPDSLEAKCCAMFCQVTLESSAEWIYFVLSM